ncbi:MAG: TetR family transcriptional regulator [Solirubrobacteraceae bacterium]
MSIPLRDPEPQASLARPGCRWAQLDPEAKRERLLSAAAEVFRRDGLDAPMSEVAEAAGAGVASVYRCFSSKHELLAALVARRLDQTAQAADEATRSERDHWSALTEMLTTLVRGQAADDFLGEARVAVADDAKVIAAGARATAAIDRLLAAARDEGRLRADATTLDVRLLFAATRAAKQIEPERWTRMLALLIDALDTRRSAP